MIKKLKVILILFHVLSVMVCVLAIDTLWERKDLVVTTAIITFVGTPFGDVMGKYIDEEGVLHYEDQTLYNDNRYLGNVDVSPLIGKTVKIAYDPVTGGTYKDHHLMCYCHIFSYILSVVLLCVYRKVTLKRIARNNSVKNHDNSADDNASELDE